MPRSLLTLRTASLAAIVLAVAISIGAADANLDSLFQSKGLTLNGTHLFLPKTEADVRDAAKRVRAAQSKIAYEATAIRDADAAVDRANAAVVQLNAEIAVVAANLAKHPEDNATIGKYNAVRGRLVVQAEVRRVAVERRNHLNDSHSAFVTAVLDGVQVARAGTRAYADVSADRDIVAALAAHLDATHTPLVLAPTQSFTADVAFIDKCDKDVQVAIIPIDPAESTPHLQVWLNGRVQRTMIWDSGAAIVSLSSKVAAAAGIRAPADGPTVSLTTAEGRKVTARTAYADAIRVGPYTVRHVECAILPADLGDVDCLLGDTFQSHFQARMDLAGHRLSLTPIDGTTTAAPGATTEPAPNIADVAPTPPVGPFAAHASAEAAAQAHYREAVTAADTALIDGLNQLLDRAIKAGRQSEVDDLTGARQRIQDRLDAGEPAADAFGVPDWAFRTTYAQPNYTITRATAGAANHTADSVVWQYDSMLANFSRGGRIIRFTRLDTNLVFYQSWATDDAADVDRTIGIVVGFGVPAGEAESRKPKAAAALFAARDAAERRAHGVRRAALVGADTRLVANLGPTPPADPSTADALAQAKARLDRSRLPQGRPRANHWKFAKHTAGTTGELTFDGTRATNVDTHESAHADWQGNIVTIRWASGAVDRVQFFDGRAFIQTWDDKHAASAPTGDCTSFGGGMPVE